MLTMLASVTLLWVAPTTDADGGPLTDLANYGVYEAPTDTGPWNRIGSPTETTFTTAADDGTCYRVTAIDTAGNESAPSNVACYEDTTPPASPRQLRVE